MASRLRIGEVAELAGISTRAIRHYHRIGLLPEPGRETNGYRTYDPGDVARLLRVRRLVELGLSLDEVADVLGDGAGVELREILIGLVAELAAQERRLARNGNGLTRCWPAMATCSARPRKRPCWPSWSAWQDLSIRSCHVNE